jgi:hypothetical protein
MYIYRLTRDDNSCHKTIVFQMSTFVSRGIVYFYVFKGMKYVFL